MEGGITILKQYIFKYKWFYVIGILMLWMTNVAQMYIPKATAAVTDGITIGNLDIDGVVEILKMLVLSILMIVIGRMGWRFTLVGSGRKIEKEIREALFTKWLKLDITYFNENKTGNLMAYATNDLNAIRMMTGMGVIVIFDAVIMSLMVIYTMATFVNLKLTLVAVIPMPIIAISGIYMKNHIHDRFLAKQRAFANLSDQVQESFAGIKVIKAFVQEKQTLDEFEKICQDNYIKNISLAKISAFMNPAMQFLVGVSLLISIGYGGYMTINNEITAGSFIAFNQYILMLTWPMSAITHAINVYAQGLAAAKRIEEVLNAEEVILDNENSISKDSLEGSISIKNFNFDFPDNNQPALRDINLEVKSGQTLAILGRTGSGKSTLVNILLRFYNIEENKLFLGGHDIMKLCIKTVRGNIAYVPQDNFLFSDTVKNNIGFGLWDYDDDLVQEAAKKANVHQNIINFSDKYETVVGEKGTMLSGGQKQRISIARALILAAPILILDDSLSAVDTKTEETILNNLKKVRNGKTNIIIAHRISTVRNADKIIVMEEGKIAEQGTHDSLIELGGIYAKMHKQQQLKKGGDTYEG
ncbi:hypothetical protein AN639_07855 [Candidatus Epulonipiscium fishelsonii]|uniref:Uncharacterized protein n=1 Tax=Candidatus Epulonipiscium fishelsonii TaxID=77094 RepID=A0ACC8X8I7_9FIRM|nr:hypothetical protein AN396_11045 [Epulopiscium sp. SCG-B11WGA-EpuloA1]ONI38424.1 hypothetical protein AN639_07855 [Epulopiscium sp. SCG-B05WGA-EpuloA1]ONI47960.1 hypothetical protein AN644_03285 [Epulopiscium sp. SCG-C06WGA-EpuloA1]